MAKFLVVHPYLDIYGGGERVCHHVIKSLLNHQQDVELLTFNFDEVKYSDIVGESLPKQVTIHSLGKRTKEKPPFTIYKRHRNYVKLLKNYRNRLQYDYLFSTQSSSPFEPVFLNKAKKNIAYVHFPEIHYDYKRGSLKRKLYLWLFKHWVEQGIIKLDLIFCNSNYTREALSLWRLYKVKDPIVVYPPVNLEKFWCDKPFSQRQRSIIYVARFIPAKRHEILKQLATSLPKFKFISIGGLIEAEKPWFERFSKDLPPNYTLKPNLPTSELIKLLQDSRIYVHLMEGEHFGIAPVEGLASGCIPIVHDSGGMKEFIPQSYRWQTVEDLKEKITQYMEAGDTWQPQRKELWNKIAALTPQVFENNIWLCIENLMDKT